MGLGYPGGPALSKWAQSGNPQAFKLPRPLLHSGNFDFSYADKFHCQYQSKQSTLAWFDAIGLARNEHKFSQWFNTNAITQSMFLLECPDELIMKYLDLDTESIAGMLDYKIV
jgi:hypothetical protein